MSHKGKATFSKDDLHTHIDSLQLDLKHLPHHVAFIMDGNGRWATHQGQERTLGHRAGVQTVKSLVTAFVDLGIPVMTVYAFSTENWLRPKYEVAFLMMLFEEVLRKECRLLKDKGVRIRFIGQREALPVSLQKIMAWAEKETAANQKLSFNIAFNYGGRAEIVEATRRIAQDIQAGRLDAEALTESLFQRYLYTADWADPDLVIRTSGEMRISNYMLWQIAYAELWVTQTCWPDFGIPEFMGALRDFQQRQRRFGS